MKHNLVIKPRPSDYLAGVNSPITFKAVSNGDWLRHVWFTENQRNPNFDTDGCAPFGANRSLDMQMDLLLSTAPASIVNQLSTMGFMDTGIDGNPHFHSSPRFTENLTGNGTNGNSIPECFDVIRKYGVIPWSAMPFDPTMTQAEYFTTPTPAQLALGQQFLSLMGGKNFLQYHWLWQDKTKNTSQMQNASLQAPLNLGIAVPENGWNQVTPVDPPASQDVEHVVTEYKMVAPSCDVADNYAPYLKVLDAGYPIPFCLQAVVTLLSPIVTSTPTPPAPLPPDPNPVQESNWLTAISQWITQLENYFKGRTNLGSINMTNFSFLKSGATWSSVVLVLSAVFTALNTQYPTVTWIGVVVSLLSFISINYFHKQGVMAAAVSSAALGKTVSGQ